MHDVDPQRTYHYLTHPADPDRLAQTAAPFSLIEDILLGTPARERVLILDTCESGELGDDDAGGAVNDARPRGLRTKRSSKAANADARRFIWGQDRLILADLDRIGGNIVLSSSLGAERSWESDALKNGFFTHALLRALRAKEADVNGDGPLSVEELRDYVAREVVTATGGAQHPTIDRDNVRATARLDAEK